VVFTGRGESSTNSDIITTVFLSDISISCLDWVLAGVVEFGWVRTDSAQLNGSLVSQFLDGTQLQEFQDHLQEFSIVVPTEVVKGLRFDVLESVIEHLGGDSVTIVTIGKSLEDKHSVGGLVFQLDLKANSLGEGFELETGSWGLPVTSFLSVSDLLRMSFSSKVSLFHEHEFTGVSDGHDTVTTDGTFDLNWIDGGLGGLEWNEFSVGSDSNVPFKPS